MVSQLVVLLLGLAVASPAWAEDEGPIPDNVKGIKLVIPEARGTQSWGRAKLSKSLRRKMTEAVGPLIPSRDFKKAQKKLKLRGSSSFESENLAKAARAVGAQYVLAVTISKKGWLFTARAILVNAKDGEVQMDFRSQYFNPIQDASDRGKRIARRTIEKVSQLLSEAGAVAVAPPPSGSETPPPPKPPPPARDPEMVEKPDAKKSPHSEPPNSERVDEPSPPPPPIAIVEDPPPPPRGETERPQQIEVEAEPARRTKEFIRGMVGGGSGVLHAYTLASDAVQPSRLSHQLKPLSLVALELEFTIPGVDLAIIVGGAFRPVRYDLKFSDASPRGALIDSHLIIGYNIRLAGKGIDGYQITPRIGGRVGINPVQENPGNSVLSARAISVIGGVGARLPINEVLEIDLGVDGGVILSYVESPASSGESGLGYVIAADLAARIWLNPMVAIAFDNRFTFESIGFDGTSTRQLPDDEPDQIENANISIKDLRTSIGVAFRF